MADRDAPSTEQAHMPPRIQAGFVDLCASCGKNRFAHVPDPPDDYWPDCTTFVASSVIDAAHIEHQREWSTATFGPCEVRGPSGPLAHIRKEVEEVAADPTVLEEWVDVIILAFDGAWRAGHEPQQIIDAVKAKQVRNEGRTWPDWRGVPADQAIEHVRSDEPCTHTDCDCIGSSSGTSDTHCWADDTFGEDPCVVCCCCGADSRTPPGQEKADD